MTIATTSYIINDIRGGSRAATTSEMEHFVVIVNRFQSLTVITKSSIVDVAATLDTPPDIFTIIRPLLSYYHYQSRIQSPVKHLRWRVLLK